MLHPAYISTRARLAWHHLTNRPSPETLCRWVYEYPFPTILDRKLPSGMPPLRRGTFAVMRAVADYLERVKPVNYQQWLVAREHGTTGLEWME